VTTYRKTMPYRRSQTYRGLEAVPAVGVPGVRGVTTSRWEPQLEADRKLGARWRQTAPHEAGRDFPYDENLPRGKRVAARFGPGLAEERRLAARWDPILPHARLLAAQWRPMDPLDAAYALPWGDLERHEAAPTTARFRSLTPHAVALEAAWSRLTAHSAPLSAFWREVARRGGYVALPWGPIGARSSGTRIDWPVESNPPPDVITVPTLPVYVMLPTLSCVRLPDRTPINLLGISLQAERGSWAWSFTAPMPAADVALLNAPGGEPTQIEVTVNGWVWSFAVDAYDDNRRFGSRTVTLRGRSRSMLLAAPYAATRTFTEAFDRTASQLAADELPMGWTLFWDAPNWLVPGGTFSYADLAPMDAISQIANAIGASVLSDPSDLKLTVQPTYPVSPWAWDEATPYAVLPASILTEGDSSWQGGTNATGVYVYAQNIASGAFVKLAGSDGATQLPMVVETLLVHPDAQRERGRADLAAAGMRRTVNRTLPLFPTPAPAGQPDLGPVPIGKLVEVQDVDETWRGQVMAVRIDAQRSGGPLSVRQHLTIERQYR
jgi:hypothetical protein